MWQGPHLNQAYWTEITSDTVIRQNSPRQVLLPLERKLLAMLGAMQWGTLGPRVFTLALDASPQSWTKIEHQTLRLAPICRTGIVN